MTEEELQALIDEEQEYIQKWRDGLTQEQINSIQVMEIFGAFAGMALIILAMAILFNGGITITIKKK